MKDLRHSDDPFSANWDIGNTRQHGAIKGAASSEVKLWVQREIVVQARTQNLSETDIINLLAIAEIESGFNPSAATNAHPLTSASGVFQITDSTAKDIANRLDKKAIIGGYDITHDYERFDPSANIDFGIAYYLDRKRAAGGTTDLNKIYAAWNTNPAEYEKVSNRLQKAYDKFATDKSLLSENTNSSRPSRSPINIGGPFTNPLSWTGGGNGDSNNNAIPDILESQEKHPKSKLNSSQHDTETLQARLTQDQIIAKFVMQNIQNALERGDALPTIHQGAAQTEIS